MLRAAIVGMGRWGRVLVDSVQNRSSLIQFVAGTTRSLDKVEAYASSQRIELMETLDRVLARRDVEAVVLATPHSQHAAQIAAAARAGKHVLVEKPMTLTRESAIQAFASAEAAGVKLGVAHNRRFLPAYRALAALVEQDRLGTVLQMIGNFSSPSGASYTPGAWRASRQESPAGGMTALGIHILDAMIGLGATFDRVCVLSRQRVLANGLDDTTTALCSFADGAVGVVTTMIATPARWCLEVYGTKGWAAMDGETRLVHKLAGETAGTIDYPAIDIERAELEAFAGWVTRDEAYPITKAQAIHGVAAFETICAASERDDASERLVGT